MLPDPAVVLKEASATTKELTSAHLLLSVDGEIDELPVKRLEGDLTNEPSTAAKGKAKIAMMGAEVGIRFVMFGRRLYVALPQGDWRDYGPTSKVYDVTAILDPDSGLANVLANFVDPRVEARETVDGQQTLRVAGKVTAEAVNKMVPPLDAAKRLPCTVWIQERGDHQVVEAKLAPGKDESIQMTFSNWNAPVKVDKPGGPPPPPPPGR